jgi:hypothetical protein
MFIQNNSTVHGSLKFRLILDVAREGQCRGQHCLRSQAKVRLRKTQACHTHIRCAA